MPSDVRATSFWNCLSSKAGPREKVVAASRRKVTLLRDAATTVRLPWASARFFPVSAGFL